MHSDPGRINLSHLSITAATDIPQNAPVRIRVAKTLRSQTFWIAASAIISANESATRMYAYLSNCSPNLRHSSSPATNPANADASLTHTGSCEPFRWKDLEES